MREWAAKHLMKAGLFFYLFEARIAVGTIRWPRLSFFTLKSWFRPSCLIPNDARVQKQLGEFQIWHNEPRTHRSHRAQAPNEELTGVERDPVRHSQSGCKEQTIRIDRKSSRD